jgi:NADP-dependent 3-hydroxy acid dehydrogenase YdfG
MEAPLPAPVTKWHNDTYDAIDPKCPELSMAGKIIVITGAGAGIGRETVRAFALAGATSIHILGRTESTLAETKEIVEKDVPGVSVSLHTADVVDEIAVRKAASEVGSWDILISNAGYLPAKNPIQEADLNDWWLGFEVGPL